MKRPFSSVPDLREHACGRVRKLLDSYLAGELTVESNHEILDHAESCARCSGEVDARGRLRVAIKRIEGEMPGPRPGFEAEIRARLAQVPPAGLRASPAALLVAATLLVGVGLMVTLLRPGGEPHGAAPIAGRRQPPDPAPHAVDLAAFDLAATTQLKCADANQWPDAGMSQEQLEQNLAKVDDVRFAGIGRDLIAKLGGGYRLVAAHRCSHDSPFVIHLILKGNGPGVLSVVAFPKRHGGLPGGGLDSIAGSDAAGRSVALIRAERQGVRVLGAEGVGDLFFVSASRGSSEEAQVEVGRRLLPFLTTAI